ncbi:MAG: T9SS type A sorting domain-containing protein, partial [Bacteroidetes bacterium]|nr:T9SS type A sorting domain-containing protein [Bacteroidota bacterium]
IDDIRYFFTSDTIQAAMGDQLRLFAERFRGAGWPESTLAFRFQVWRALDGSLVADTTLAPTTFPTDSADVWTLTFALNDVAGAAVYLTLGITGTGVSADEVLIYRKYLDITDVEKGPGEPRASAPRPEGIALRTYPNPVTDVLRIDCDTRGVTRAIITLHDVFGRTLRTIEAEVPQGRGTYQIDTRSLVPGMYYISAVAGTRKTIAPLVVIR